MATKYKNGLIINETNVTDDVSSFIIDNRGSDGFSVTYKWTSTLTGTFALFCCDDVDAVGTNGVGWVPVNNHGSGTFSTDPAGTAGEDEDTFTGTHAYYRIDFTHGANSGDLLMALNVRVDGK